MSSHSSDEGIGMSPVAVLGSPSNSVTLAEEDDQDMVEELLRGIANEATAMTAPVGLPDDFSMTCEDAQDLLNQLQEMPPTPGANTGNTFQVLSSSSVVNEAYY